ncbi:MAG: hypothetical protein NTX15_05400 [Candidatus Kapabacteria bacterium]|nr:hypothetical protein [Candidatus Kapabacteria bacterium]
MSYFNVLVLACFSATIVGSCASDTVATKDPVTSTALGTVTLVVSIDGSRTKGTGIVETKTVLANGNLKFDLTSVPVTTVSGVRTINWDNQKYGGATFWSTDHTTTYECNSKTITNRDLTVLRYTSTPSTMQPGGGTMNINADGTYQLAIVAQLATLNPGSSVEEIWENCIGTSYNKLEGPATIPFITYFTPFTNGALGSFSGTINPANPNSIKGSFHGTDSLTVFSEGTTVTNIPIEFTITWDVLLK